MDNKFDYKEAFNTLMELIDGGSYVQEGDVDNKYFRQYYIDNDMSDELEWMDEEDER